MYRNLSNLYPRSLKLKFRRIIDYTNLRIQYEKLIGFMIFSSLCMSLIFSFLISFLLGASIYILIPALFIVMQILFYFILILNADAKGKFIEDILPDALQLMSSNLKAGLTTDKALLLSARPEFGPFSDELNIVGKEITMGKDIGKALEGMSERIKSEKLRKTILLITSGLRSGGELALLLNQTAQNLRSQKFVDERIKSNVLMYVIFIFSAIGFGAPLLFGLSSFLVETLTKSLGAVDIPAETAAQFPITLSKVSISSSFVFTYVIVSLITTCIFGSMVLGLIRKGKEREGLRYIPVLIAVSLGVFFIIRIIISNAFGATFF